jgi:Domain of unknown function (DUF5063)
MAVGKPPSRSERASYFAQLRAALYFGSQVKLQASIYSVYELHIRQTMTHNAECFTETVQRFCAWAETTQHDLIEARQHLIALMASIPLLEEFRNFDGGDESFDRRSHEDGSQDHKRFSDLPFQYYRTVFDPHDLESTDETSMVDLHDDLADVYGDLWNGLQAHRAGQTKTALGIWVSSYFYHWGYHASSAFRAIDEFCRKDRNLGI